ncbi:protein draper-like [Pecten maximus]|uniref:protein draper-like n=1 Tax=Pecten maximus TaxID=6579 RepID=UPI001458D5D1|nr:protein draper-like [Pecten maximus]
MYSVVTVQFPIIKFYFHTFMWHFCSFHAFQSRANGYQFFISNGTDVPSGIKCYEDVDAGNPNVIQNITSCNLTGKTLMIYIKNTSGYAHMDVCEVDVYGCFSNKYGDQCQNDSNCKHGCDPDNGVCDSPYCNAGWSGSRFCDQPCSQVTFGENCLQRCHCKTPGCNSQTGVCLIPGCQAGYSGASCSQACINTRFGENCSSECHCNTPGCDSVSGRCTIPGCAAGWKGETCSTSCSEGEFGKGCKVLCHCAEPGCNKENGICTKPNTGCLAGWNGTTCSQDSPELDEIEAAEGSGGVIGGVVGSCVVAIVAVVAIILLKRRHETSTRNKYKESVRDPTDDNVTVKTEENNPREKILSEDNGTRSNSRPTEDNIVDEEETIYMNNALDHQ